MSIETDLTEALSPLVSERAYPACFPQNCEWPAIRFSFPSIAPGVSICGDGGDETADISVQIDVVARTFDAMRALRGQVMTAMSTFDPPATCSGTGETYDADAKAHRCLLDYQLHPSSEPD